MDGSTSLATTGSGGVRQRTVQQMLGTATWITAVVARTDPAPIRTTVYQFAASGINTLLLFDPLIALLRASQRLAMTNVGA